MSDQESNTQPAETYTGSTALDSRLDRLAEEVPNATPQSESDSDTGERGGSQDSAGSAENAVVAERGTSAGQVNGQGKAQGKQVARGADDIVDAQGNVIARAGAERRIFEKAIPFVEGKYRERLAQGDQAQQQLRQIAPRLQQAEMQVQAYQQADRTAEQFKLTPQDRSLAYNLLASYRQDPSKTLQFMIAEAAKSGISIDGLTNGLDTQVMQRMLDDRLAPVLGPIQQQQQQHAEQQRLSREVESDVETFRTQYPDATPHHADIAKLLNADHRMSPERAYWELKNYASQHGLDFNQPLGPQVYARQQGQTRDNAQRPLPGGFSQARNAGPVQSTTDYANMSTRDIVRMSLRESGFNLAD